MTSLLKTVAMLLLVISICDVKVETSTVSPTNTEGQPTTNSSPTTNTTTTPPATILVQTTTATAAAATTTTATATTPTTTTPTTTPQSCNDLTAPPNGRVNGHAAITGHEGQVVIFTCAANYTLIGEDTTACKNGSWNGTHPQCLQTCGNVTAPTNGKVNETTSISGQVVIFTCDPNYTRIGEDTMACKDGSWNGTPPKCLQTCGNITAPSNGRVNESATISGYEGQVVIFACAVTYTRIGEKTTTCKEGSWNGTQPRCLKTCGPVTAPSNGRVNESTTITGYEGQVVIFTCDPNYTRIGENTTACKDGSWNGTPPRCLQNCDDSFTVPTNGQVNVTSTLYQGQSAHYSCNTDYTLVGEAARTCQSGALSGSLPVCLQNCKGSMTKPTNGQVNATSTLYEGQSVHYTCDSGYTLEGNKTRTCQSGLLAGHLPSCMKIPSIPTASIQSQSESEIVLSLTRTDNVTHCFTVQLGPGSVPGDYCNSTLAGASNTANFTYSSVPGQCYNFSVYARHEHVTNNASFALQACTKPAKPTAIIHDQNTTSVTLHITKGPGNVDCYIIHKETGSDTDCVDPVVSGLYPYTGLRQGNCYNFSVQARYNGLTSDAFRLNNACTQPAKPVNPTPKISARSVTLTWSFSGGYDQFIVKDGVKNITQALAVVAVGDGKFRGTVTHLMPATSYSFTLTAVKGNVTGEPATVSPTTEPDRPANCSFDANHRLDTSILLQWQPGEGRHDGFTVKQNNSTMCSAGEELCGSQSRDYNATGLPPGLKSCFKIQSTFNSVYSDPCEICAYTRPPSPTNGDFKSISETGFTVTWTTSSAPPGVFYEVWLQEKQQQQQQQQQQMNTTTATELTYSNLVAGTRYAVPVRSVLTVTDDGGPAKLYGMTDLSLTTSTKPYPASLTAVTVPHETNFIVNWNRPPSGGYDSFLLTVSPAPAGGSNVTAPKGDNSKVITGLQPGTAYNVTMYAVFNGALSSQSSTLKDVYTRPAPPTNVKIPENGINTNSLQITWDASKTMDTCYVIVDKGSVAGGNRNNSVACSLQTFTLFDLTPGELYEIHVYSSVAGVLSERYANNTTHTKPTAVKISLVNKNTTGLHFNWTSGSNASSVSFVVAIRCESPNHATAVRNKTETTSTPSYQVDGLDPGTRCTVTVTSMAGSEKGNSSTAIFFTQETAPGLVTALDSPSVTARSVEIGWEKPAAPNGVVRRYVIMVSTAAGTGDCVALITLDCDGCPDADGDGCQDTPQKGGDCPRKGSEKFSKDQQQFGYNVTGLHPYRGYTVSVSAYTQCSGPPSSVPTNTTEARQEAAPGNLAVDFNELENISYWRITLRWSEPTDLNGVITEYTVRSKFINDTTCYGTSNITLEKEKTTQQGLVGTIMTLNHLLRSDWTYNFSVTAATQFGHGDYSKELSFTTPTSRPGGITTASVTPTDVHSYNASLHWAPPCYPNGQIAGYKVKWSTELANCPEHGESATTDNTNSLGLALKPSRTYSVKVAAINVNGTGNFTTGTSVATDTAAPNQPTITGVTVVSASAVRVSWSIDHCLYTGPTTYTVTTTDVEDNTVSMENAVCVTSDFSTTTCIVPNLDAYWTYTFTVTAQTDNGTKSSLKSEEQRTFESVPGHVSNLSATPVAEESVTSPRTITVAWQPPVKRDLNGVITNYYVIYQGQSSMVFSKETDARSMMQVVVPGNYTVKVFAATSEGNATVQDVSTRSVIVPPGAPPKPQEQVGGPAVRSVETTGDKKKTVAIQVPTQFLCDSSSGGPVEWGLIAAQDSTATDQQYFGSAAAFKTKLKDFYKTWFDVKDSDPIQPYRVTHKNWNPCQEAGRRRRKRSSGSPELFVVGSESCGSRTGDSCNGELKPGRGYRVKAFACTAGGCTETTYSSVIETERLPDAPASDPTIPAILGVLAAVVVLAAVGVAVFVMRRRQAACFAKGDSEEPFDTPMDEKNVPSKTVRLIDFPDYVDNLHKDANLRFSEQYQTIKDMSPGHPISVAESQPCRLKNRYTNIMPFDKSRVKLLPMDDEEGSDFINANYIPGYTSRREYIATQGPMPATKDDFWRMVWEQNVEVIVMLTRCMENGRVKCEKYWPEVNEPLYFGDLIVSVESESTLSDYIIRIIEVKLDTEARRVRQLCFLKWPDMGCPDEPSMLLNFVQTVRQHAAPAHRDGPIIVHCSAGVGRTGTFIAVDHLLRHIRDHDDVDIFRLVLELRDYRCNMVQTEDQYVYIHECIKEFLTVDDEEDEDEDDEPLYANTGRPTDHTYENTAFNSNM